MLDDLSSFSEMMKQDWNKRALENAKWFINTVSLTQSDEEFFAGGKQELLKWWLPDFTEALQGRDLRTLKVMEIGCGIGRMTCHLADIFGEVWAVDVSGEMIRQGKERFSHLKNITWVETEGITLNELPDDYFDLGFSVYVYQHMPSRDVISSSISQAYRKIRPAGFYKFHTNALVKQEYNGLKKDTWTGEAFRESDIRRLALSINAKLISILGGGHNIAGQLFRSGQKQDI
ncbi:MAG: class I SAM-dependent methyltransferase [Blastocatellia bacterium]